MNVDSRPANRQMSRVCTLSVHAMKKPPIAEGLIFLLLGSCLEHRQAGKWKAPRFLQSPVYLSGNHLLGAIGIKEKK